MKIFGNIRNGYKLFRSVGVFNKLIKEIEAVKATGDTEKERELIASSTAVWVNDVIELFDIDFRVEGKENIPEGPCVFYCNHQGYGDIVLMLKACEGKQIGFIAKDTLQKLPYFGTWIKTIRGVFIKRGYTRESLKAIRDGVELLKQGFSLVIFPEGTRSKGGEMKEFKAGSFKLATKAKVPIVPVAIHGTYRIFEETQLITSGATAYARILEPINTAEMDRKELKEIHTVVQNLVAENLEDLRAKDKDYVPFKK